MSMMLNLKRFWEKNTMFYFKCLHIQNEAFLHGIEGTNWGNLPLLKRIYDVKSKFHLFGHTHGDYGIIKQDGIVFSNATLLGHTLNLEQEPVIINI